jgi:hypothetical protein
MTPEGWLLRGFRLPERLHRATTTIRTLFRQHSIERIRLRGKGINYDTGVSPGGKSSRECFDPDVVQREMQIIAGDLHCNAVRISGGDPARLTIAGEHAGAAGLEVWFVPFPCELTVAQMLPLFADRAQRAEELPRAG